MWERGVSRRAAEEEGRGGGCKRKSRGRERGKGGRRGQAVGTAGGTWGSRDVGEMGEVVEGIGSWGSGRVGTACGDNMPRSFCLIIIARSRQEVTASSS